MPAAVPPPNCARWPGQWHWHVSIRSSFTMRVPMIKGFVEFLRNPDESKEDKIKGVKEVKRFDFYWNVIRELRKVDIKFLLDIT